MLSTFTDTSDCWRDDAESFLFVQIAAALDVRIEVDL
jgi:hypothetical protein